MATLAATSPERRTSAAPGLVSAGADFDAIRAAAAGCRSCPLWEHATQTVFGSGPVPAPLMLVGEQPGDQEDIEGAPFVGPAGRMLDQALEAAEIDRASVFVTNVVKHFKWRPRSALQAPSARAAQPSRDRRLLPVGGGRVAARPAPSARPARGDRRAGARRA
jgi:uracil-DNA glycosylase